MTPDTIFLICNYGVLPAWALLVFAPSWVWTERIVHRIWILVLLGAVYLAVFLTGSPAAEGGGFTTLEGVMVLFTSPSFALVGWVHYLAFDLFVGAWEVRDARRLSIPHLFVVPCLAMTLMLGPIGLLAYLSLRFARTREVSLVEAKPRGSAEGI